MMKRNTKSKKAVLDYFKLQKSGLKAEDLIKELDQFDKVTIYRILHSFLEDGIIHKAVSEDGNTYYFICKDCQKIHHHNHYHFNCSNCGKVECLNKEIEIHLPSNYIVENINFWISGICSFCNTLKKPQA